MEVDITCGNITVRFGGVASYCADTLGAMLQPDNPTGVQVLSYTYGVPGVGRQVINPIPVNDDVPITSNVPVGTWLSALDSMVTLFTRTTRPPGVFSNIDEAMAVVVVPYGPLDSAMSPQLLRPTAIGNPSNPIVSAIRSAPLVFDTATINALPAVIDIDSLSPGDGWNTFGNPRPDIDDFIGWFGGFCGELWKGFGTASYTPSQQHPGYGAAMASQTGEGLLMVVSTELASKRRELARRMSQWGIDLMGAFASGRADIADGGHYQGRKALIVLALHLLESPLDATTLFPNQFNEDRQFYFQPGGGPAWGAPFPTTWTAGYTGKTEIPCNMNEPVGPAWNTSCRYYLPQYFQQEVLGTQIGCAVVMRILGLTSKMGLAHDKMVAQFMETPPPAALAAMATIPALPNAPALSTIDWGNGYSLEGANGFSGAWNFGDAAWTAYSDYEGGGPSPDPTPRIDVTGNGVQIANGDDTPSATDHTSFGTTTEGGATISRTFTVANTGDASMTIGTVTVPTGYTVTTALPSSIAAAGSAPLVVRLDSGVPGTKAGPVSIASNDPDAAKFEFFVTGSVTASGGPGGPPPLPTFPVATGRPMIRLRNLSPLPFSGVVRTTTDAQLPEVCYIAGHELRRGRRIGLDCWALDVFCTLGPNETLELDPSQASEALGSPSVPAPDQSRFGGGPRLGEVQMELASSRQDGAGWLVHWRSRVGRMFVVDLVALWHPDQPGVALGEFLVTCSNPEVPDMGEALPAIDLTFGGAHIVWPCGKLATGMRFADGQARALPVSFLWPSMLTTSQEWASAGVLAHRLIGAVGVSQLPGGNPKLPRGFQPAAWTWRHTGTLRLNDWTSPQLGPTADTGQTGAVEDQLFVGGECFADGGTGAEILTWLAGLATSGHPMHHLELDGTVVDRDRRPGLRMFYSRPHTSGADRLGKARDLTVAEANGWNGPDAQHWTINRLSAACRLVDSPVCQRLLEHHARNYLIQLTTIPGASTSHVWSAREIGWEGIAAVRLWQCLEDRALAERVKAHWQERVRNVILPWIGTKDVWDVRRDDARLGSGDWWMPWQQALGVYGLDLACEVLGPVEGRAAALRGAQRILADAWVREGDRMTEYELLALDGRRQRSGMFATAWMPLAVATVLRHESGNALAREVWQQIVADDSEGRWLPPEALLVR